MIAKHEVTQVKDMLASDGWSIVYRELEEQVKKEQENLLALVTSVTREQFDAVITQRVKIDALRGMMVFPALQVSYAEQEQENEATL